MHPYSITPGTLVVALDIGKNVHWFGCYCAEGRLSEVVPPQKVRSDTLGFVHFTATVDRLLATGRYPAVVVGNEHTGVYHEPWAWQILDHYRAVIGDVRFFATASQIWALTGYDLRTAESGDTKQIGRITKRGSPILRDTLYQIGFHTARHCPVIGETFLAARARSLSETAAVIHAAHKANRLCFELLRQQRLYQPATAEEEQRFRQHRQRYRQQRASQRRSAHDRLAA